MRTPAISRLSFLFPRLTPPASRGGDLFEALVGEARRPHWFAEGQVTDSIDGRFAVLATVAALATLRLERGGAVAQAATVALAERFVEAMDAEHRQLGIGDPALGKTVRKLVGALSRRVTDWRQTIDSGASWEAAASSSLFRGAPPSPRAVDHVAQALHRLWARLEAASDQAVAEGRIG
ncbi:MAG: ubiquinol-cytochrome C chaperone family protein [Sphingomicrobium sp.]